MNLAQIVFASMALSLVLQGNVQADTSAVATRKPPPQCAADSPPARCTAPLSLSYNLSPAFAFTAISARSCGAGGCTGLEPGSSAGGGDDHADKISRTPGPGDRTGIYLLGSIPLIVGVGSLLGIDHRLPYDNTGIWKRNRQLDLAYAVVATEIGGAFWNGGQTRLGRTFWESIDSSAFSGLTTQGLKYIFSRARPYQSSSPDHWFQGSCCQSFPSGEVTLQASFVTPFIIEYHSDHPWVWGLEALPLYDSLARMKTQGHWQTDVLSGWALGTAFGIFAHNRRMPFFLSVMPHSVMLGWHTDF